MRTIASIVIHCTATPAGRNVTVGEIRQWHRDRGWADIGYHYVIGLDGTVYEGRPIEKMGAHCIGQNAHSVGICYVGGTDKNGTPRDTRTDAQKAAMLRLVKVLMETYDIKADHVWGHNRFAAKACPSFDVEQWKKEVGL